MPQKILAGRADDPLLAGEMVQARVDQVILVQEPNRVIGEAIARGLTKPAVEVAIAYDTTCITARDDAGHDLVHHPRVSAAALQRGVLVARAGIGFPSAVHIERFAAPARLAITDDPRSAALGGIGMLTLLVAPSQLSEALITGAISLRPPRSVQVLLSGRVRPFVCVRDVALELLRRGLGETLAKIDREHGAPVVIEFAGASARLLSVPERALLCSLAPLLGAAGAVFVSDEKTEVYLRDQRRSKAHRSLLPDPGAPCDDVMTLDLSAVDPLLMDREGKVRPVRDLEGTQVDQAIVGGDSGASLRDLLAAAILLKSKRVPATLDFLVAPPSRQVLEVLAHSGALVDLIATGARLIEPDQRLITGELYPPGENCVSIRTFDPAPGVPQSQASIVASAETLAFAVATGEIGDPRSFKRPVRVTVPRALPTDDVLVIRKQKKAKSEGADNDVSLPAVAAQAWNADSTLAITSAKAAQHKPNAFVAQDADAVRWAVQNAGRLTPGLRVLIAPWLPAGVVSVFAGMGVLTLLATDGELVKLSQHSELTVPKPDGWRTAETVTVKAGAESIALQWPARGPERAWTLAGSAVAKL
jgi:aconitate hydratase